MVLRDQVRLLGYDVKTADEITSLNILKSFHPDIVIANLNMGDISGDKLIEHIKSIDPNICCFLSSCSKIAVTRLNGHTINGIIETPISKETLEFVLNNPGLGLDPMEPKQSEIEYTEPPATLQPSLKTAPAAPAHKICPSCQKEMEKTGADFAFCPFCGSRL